MKSDTNISTQGKVVSQSEVAICMCTYNGARFLKEQMDSFATQTHKNWRLWVSDDGSTDGTLDIIADYIERWGSKKIQLFHGPRKGFCANFLSLTNRKEISGTYFAWADQDDVWMPDKLFRAMSCLASGAPEQPALYCCRVILTDEKGVIYGLSPLHAQQNSFSNALIQNIGSGNTMVFNQSARSLITLAGKDTVPFSHDWWAYIIVTGCGGRVYYDVNPFLRYRQHDRNIIGLKQKVISRIADLHREGYRERIGQNIKGLNTVREKLLPNNLSLFNALVGLHDSKNWCKRLYYLWKLGFNRQTLFDNIGMLVASLIGKI